MLFRFRERWSKATGFTASELAVLRLLLPAGNQNAERLYLQATSAPYIERTLVASSGCVVNIPCVLDDSMLIECDENRESPTLLVSTTKGSVIRFKTTVLRGGFLQGLTGHTSSGECWDKEWVADLTTAVLPGGIDTWLPRPMSSDVRDSIAESLYEWAGLEGCSVPCRDLIRVALPATNEQIRTCESRLRIRLNGQYKEMLSLSNGFGIRQGRTVEILGSGDIDFIDGCRDWLCLTPLYEEGCVAIRCIDDVITSQCSFVAANGAPKAMGDVKQHVRKSLPQQLHLPQARAEVKTRGTGASRDAT